MWLQLRSGSNSSGPAPTALNRHGSGLTNGIKKLLGIEKLHKIKKFITLSVHILSQCCGSRRFLTGSGYNFQKRLDPDPDPDPKKLLANFFLNFFLMKICSKKYLHGPKS
jgi:hypothetical protein